MSIAITVECTNLLHKVSEVKFILQKFAYRCVSLTKMNICSDVFVLNRQSSFVTLYLISKKGERRKEKVEAKI
jgi:hypothetical protein